MNFQVPRNNNIENIPKFSVFVLNIIKAVKYIAVFNFQSIMFDNIFC